VEKPIIANIVINISLVITPVETEIVISAKMNWQISGWKNLKNVFYRLIIFWSLLLCRMTLGSLHVPIKNYFTTSSLSLPHKLYNALPTTQNMLAESWA